VLTGSVRDDPGQPRVTVRLIEADSGMQIWTAAYDEPHGIEANADLPARVASDAAVVAAPYGPIFDRELASARRMQQPPGLRDCFAKFYDYRRYISGAGHQEALRCFLSLVEREPQSADARAGLAMLYLDEFAFRFTRDPAQSLAAARAATAEALNIDRDNFRANLALMWLQYFDGDPEFRQSMEHTLALRPESVAVLGNAGALLVIAGDSAAGLPLLERANARAKMPPRNCQLGTAIAYLRAGHPEEALFAAQAIDAPDWIVPQAIVAAAAGLSGRHDVARAAAQRIRELDPRFEAEARDDLDRWRYDRAYQERFVAGLKAAGLRIAD
jgi:hypothetical protein